MPCITPNHDIAVRIGEDVFNLIVAKFHAGRPQLFRRISKGMDGVTVFDSVLQPFTIGETGHAIQYELRILPPPDEKFIDLHPGHDGRTGVDSSVGELLFKCGLLVRLWDPKTARRWQLDLPVTVVCRPVADGQNEWLDARTVVIAGPVPPAFRDAIDYAVLHLIRSALKRLIVPGNFLIDPPANATIRIEELPINNDLFEVDAGLTL